MMFNSVNDGKSRRVEIELYVIHHHIFIDPRSKISKIRYYDMHPSRELL